ncbi:MAG: hypothetical protein IJ151_03310 [Bacteroidales bacterium]|nr:hypothetical protein [Bacteroidales bacterium]
MKTFLLTVAAVILMAACTHTRKIDLLRHDGTAASIALPGDDKAPEFDSIEESLSDTLRIHDERGNELLIMNAVKDENGEMVAHDELKAAVVTARFRNVAERDGKVDIAFDVTIPARMTDSEWMLRFKPYLTTQEGRTELENVQVTGRRYREKQLKGYELYRKFLNSIVTDSTKFISMHQLEVFLKRNLPQIYRYKNDSSLVSREQFLSEYGVSQEEAVEHYTNDFLVRRNKRKIMMKDKMRSKYIKMPVSSEGLRIDTIVSDGNGDIVYRYVQTILVKSRMKKVSVTLDGEIYDEDQVILKVPESKPLDFYISSLSSLADESPHYISTIIHRNAEANTACYIDFEAGSSEVVPARENNGEEIHRIKQNLTELLDNESFVMDSIIITASCSPEGSFQSNTRLAAARAESVKRFFDKFVTRTADSLDVLDDRKSIRFITASLAENWPGLDLLVEKDSVLSGADKEDYSRFAGIQEPDRREAGLRQKPYYMHLRTKLYPQLRIVKFNFYLHRKGMIKDTVHTTIPDTLYARGVEAIKDRNYKAAIEILRPYQDYNTAVAYCAAGYNASARQILESLKKSDRVLYMLAIIYSRTGRKQDAIQSYLDACRMNPSLVNRGNLDPEVSALVKEYNLQELLFNIY